MSDHDVKTLIVIPARGGSKGVKKKNVKLLGGRPLIDWTIKAALKLDDSHVLVSTEDEEINRVALNSGAHVPFLRPRSLSGDDVHSSKVVLHALDWFLHHYNYRPKYVCMLLPTSPFRLAEHICEGVRLLDSSSAPSVIGITKINKHPAAFRTIENGVLNPLFSTTNLNVQRQDSAPLFYVNGALYIARSNCFIDNKSFHLVGSLPLEIPPLNSVDIDTMEDLKIAEALASSYFNKHDKGVECEKN